MVFGEVEVYFEEIFWGFKVIGVKSENTYILKTRGQVLPYCGLNVKKAE